MLWITDSLICLWFQFHCGSANVSLLSWTSYSSDILRPTFKDKLWERNGSVMYIWHELLEVVKVLISIFNHCCLGFNISLYWCNMFYWRSGHVDGFSVSLVFQWRSVCYAVSLICVHNTVSRQHEGIKQLDFAFSTLIKLLHDFSNYHQKHMWPLQCF